MLVETIYWSIDPYMRVQMPQLPINSPMIGENIAKYNLFTFFQKAFLDLCYFLLLKSVMIEFQSDRE